MRKIRVILASSLFDGHDVSINIFRKLLLKRGLEVIHLGHNRSVKELIIAASQEDVDGILVSSYQGGHNEYFRYLIDELKKNNLNDVLVFGGGGGVILPEEIEQLENYGVEKIYHALDGQKLGIDGIADDIVERLPKKQKGINSDINLSKENIPKIITLLDENIDVKIPKKEKETFVLGFTGTGGAGKSSLIDEIVNRFSNYTNLNIAVITIDPTKRTSGGALLGDRIRFNNIYNEKIFFRSLATRESTNELNTSIRKIIELFNYFSYDLIIIETPGIGQGSSGIYDICDKSIYVMTSEYGASTQLDKIDMLELADFIVINKFEKTGSEDAFREVAINLIRNKGLKTDPDKSLYENDLPLFAVSSNQFNNPGVNRLFISILKTLTNNKISKEINLKTEYDFNFGLLDKNRSHYLSQIADKVYEYKKFVNEECEKVRKYQSLVLVYEELDDEEFKKELEVKIEKLKSTINSTTLKIISEWENIVKKYDEKYFNYNIHGKEIKLELFFRSITGNELKKVNYPKTKSWADIVNFYYTENFPGYFPYTGGVFKFRRTTEDPKRQFAGEGSSDRTNKRFHFLTSNDKAKRLSVAFDGITLYGEDPDYEPDIYGKIGESGVSISTIDEMDRLLKGFDLTDPLTSVSMTINAPAPIILAMYFKVAFNRELKKLGIDKSDLTPENKTKLQIETFRKLRGTVQADMLKEDQAQNTCIFSIDFAMKLIGDVQEYLTNKCIKNYYSLSISGYHIAEAGANPITQTAFTLANGFTYVEYFLKRGMAIDEFAPNLSFFFSNGLDPEYAVIGRVARRIWAIAIRDLYKGNERSQKLKYHIQTSGRSLHAKEITFNDIRTTLQALTAYYDNCNSLHTNSYDEAITTPTEESVRKSMAIQMIISNEMGTAKSENILQGSYFIEELTNLVEEEILQEFYRISHRGGVLGALEKQYQRAKIQEESMIYEAKKQSGELPIIGVNKFVDPNEKNPYEGIKVTRCSKEEKEEIIKRNRDFKKKHSNETKKALDSLEKAVINEGNIFEELLETVEHATLGQITNLLYKVGGKYRRGI